MKFSIFFIIVTLLLGIIFGVSIVVSSNDIVTVENDPAGMYVEYYEQKYYLKKCKD